MRVRMAESLPIKYRPRVYEDLVGQDLVVRFLRALSKRQLGRNLIFCGPWGAGKTSSARIYAKSLNCTNLSDSGNPCYSCEPCLDETNIIELDAASASGKDDVRNLIEISKTPPLCGKYRIIIADEAQQFSRAAWDALLKTIEEPKPFQVFIFSTTEINKVREAIKSRCQCLEVKLLDHETSKHYLKKICNLENFKFEETALDIIAFLSKGHPRDLIKNLEQVSLLGDITIENTRIIFNLSYLTNLITLLLKLIKKDTVGFWDCLETFNENPRNVLDTFKQLNLYFYYNYLNKVFIDLNPLFSLIPEEDKNNLWNEYRGILLNEPSENFQKILSKLSEISDDSFVSIDIGLLNLHNFIHFQKFKSNDKTTNSITELSHFVNNISEKPTKGRGRQFVTMQKSRQPASLFNQDQISSPDKITPELLKNKGFIEKKAEELNICFIDKKVQE